MDQESRRRARRLVLRDLIRDVRKGAGLSQVELAERLGRPQSFVSDFEQGQRKVDILELDDFCEACGITLTEFTARLTVRLSESG
jgi:transcriptional regulator with XRE-family HTH domain